MTDPLQAQDELASLRQQVAVLTAERDALLRQRASDDRFRRLADAAPVLIWLSGPDARCTYFNQPWLNFTGRTLDQELGNGWTEGVHPADYARCLDVYLTAFHARQPFSMEYRLRRADGEYRWVLDNGVPHYLSDGTFDGYIGSCVDVTEHHQLEAALRAGEANLSALINHTDDRIWSVDTQYRLITANTVFRERVGQRLGYPIHIGDNVLYPDLPSTNLAEWRADYDRALNGEAFSVERETWVAATRHWIDYHFRPIVMDGRIIGVTVLGRDITDRKQLEEDLREREENFRNLVENSPDGILIGAADGRHVYANPQAAQLLRYAPGELLQTTQKDLADPAAYPLLQQRLQDRLAGRPVPATYETRIRRKDGSSFPADITGTRTIWQGQVCDLVLFRDITERKRVEDALRASELKLKTLFELLPVGVSVLDADNQITYLNPALERILDMTHDGLRQGDYRQRTYLRSDGTHMPASEFASVRAARDHCAVYNVETGVVKDDGQVVWTNVSAVPVVFPDWRIVIATADITALKQAEEKAAQLAAIVESSEDIIIRKTLDGIISGWNSGAERIYGYTAPDVIGQPISMLVPADQVNEMPHILDQIKAGLHIDHFETVRQRKDGQVFPVALTISPIKNAAGQIIAASTIGHDITARKQAEAALREKDTQLRAILESTAEGILAVDNQGRVLQASQRFAELWQVPQSLIDRGDDQALLDFVLSQLTNPELFLTKVQLLYDSDALDMDVLAFKDGRFFERSSAAMVMDGVRLGRVWSFRDITVRKRAEQTLHELNATLEQRVLERTRELAEANLRLSELDKMKDEFVSRIGHELRTPLTNIKIYIELLEVGKPEKRDKYLQTLKREADRLHILIEDLLRVSQLSADGVELLVGPAEVNRLICDRLVAWRELAARHGLEIQTNLAADLPFAVIDQDFTVQIIGHVIHNAINYTPEGAITISTATRSDDTGRWVTIRVADTGPGITGEDLPHIFERFYRGRAAADYKTPGTGVGLSISREIVQKMGGRLTVETQVGVGSTFTVWLPVA